MNFYERIKGQHIGRKLYYLGILWTLTLGGLLENINIYGKITGFDVTKFYNGKILMCYERIRWFGGMRRWL